MDLNLKQYLTTNQDLVNQALNNILDRFDPNRELVQAMKHSIMAGGKRLRPILAIASAQACKNDILLSLPAGCAIEMVHTYSLIHDDLPAMDDDDLRRGLPTCHKQFSEPVAILAGDALLTHAFNILSNPSDLFEIYPDDSICLKLIHLLSDASGIQGMVEGQMLDMQSYPETNSNMLDHLKKIHHLKTGRMIIASVQAGAMSVNADPSLTNNLTCYAQNIGLAFQVYDDILNVEGDQEKMGKATGSDLVNDKMTFPAIIGLDESKKYAKKLVALALDSLSDFDEQADPLRAIANYIIDRDH